MQCFPAGGAPGSVAGGGCSVQDRGRDRAGPLEEGDNDPQPS